VEAVGTSNRYISHRDNCPVADQTSICRTELIY
jgi:hypothetical protein